MICCIGQYQEQLAEKRAVEQLAAMNVTPVLIKDTDEINTIEESISRTSEQKNANNVESSTPRRFSTDSRSARARSSDTRRLSNMQEFAEEDQSITQGMDITPLSSTGNVPDNFMLNCLNLTPREALTEERCVK
ncbi:hypothetical protein PoB_005107300 [Plakobranchus ocellatus]|uniref:Uncharacterized protein n=1 Tax=Plakobranchus ocellatus TaxID=259542 RepID=A0AAV4C0G6_9GAST|nr:hypothetical protein PoB_005107300 [Plakobranchus ocellatus]